MRSIRFWFVAVMIWLMVQNVTHQPTVIQTAYGNFYVTEPVLIELFEHPAVQRIKKVHHYGTAYYVRGYKHEYTRYDHCVGDWAILRMFGASLEEQIAGLLHDVSHTIFSHVGDYVFRDGDGAYSYQDDIHDWYLKEQGIDKLLERYNIRLADVNPKNKKHAMQENELPNLCADRIDYNLRAGLMTDLLSGQEVQDILHDLSFEHDYWYLHNVALAKKLGLVSLYNTLHVWGGPEEYLIDTASANMLKRAMEIGLITRAEAHFSTDDIVWNKLAQSNDPIIKQHFFMTTHYKDMIEHVSRETSDHVVRTKFRGIDPLIKTAEGVKRLTDLDQDYKKEYEQVKKQVASGWPIKLKTSLIDV